MCDEQLGGMGGVDRSGLSVSSGTEVIVTESLGRGHVVGAVLQNAQRLQPHWFTFSADLLPKCEKFVFWNIDQRAVSRHRIFTPASSEWE